MESARRDAFVTALAPATANRPADVDEVRRTAGRHERHWDDRDGSGAPAAEQGPLSVGPWAG